MFFPLPHIADFLEKLGKAKDFNGIDIATAYYQVRITKGNMYKTIYLTNKDLYKYIKMLFELYNAPETF